MAEKNLLLGSLNDVYGEFLSDKQRRIVSAYYDEDLSLAEIAENEGITRQGVWDIIRRAEKSMRRFEEKTGLVARFARERDVLSAAEEKLTRIVLARGESAALAEEIRRDLQELRHGI